MLSCEFADFPSRVLQHYFPSADHYGDIRQLDGTKYRGTIDVLTGGFPCQPFSAAGQRRGTEDNRFLWPEMLRVIREIRPTWIVAENVRGITSIDNGLVFERVCSELEADGYDVQALCIPARAVNAPHRRDRMWFIASDTKSERQPRFKQNDCASVSYKEEFAEPSNNFPRSWDEMAGRTRGVRSDNGVSFAMASLEVTAYGNAIVPQIAYRIFQAIEQAELGAIRLRL